MKNLESKNFEPNKNKGAPEKQKAEKLLESETDINSSLLRKIAENSNLRKAFYIVAFSVGLLIGQETLAQQKSEEKVSGGINVENVMQEKEEIDIEQVVKKFTEYIKNNKYFSKYPHSLMSWVAAAEDPKEYQSQQIVNLHDKISRDAQSQEFKTTTELMAYINSSLILIFLIKNHMSN